jgi:hypothetical protein
MTAVTQVCNKLHTLGTTVLYSETHPRRKCSQRKQSKVDAFSFANTLFLIFYYIHVSKLGWKHQSNKLLLTVPQQQLKGEIQRLKMNGGSNTSEANTPYNNVNAFQIDCTRK